MFDIMSTGIKYLDAAIIDREHVCHVRSDKETPSYSPKVLYEIYIDSFFTCYRDILKKYEELIFIPCSEKGVEYCEIFTTKINANVNDPSLSKARYMKNEMNQAIRNAGLRCINEALVRNSNEISEWVNNNPTIFGYVVKPVRNAASDKVYVCDGQEDGSYYLSKILGENNIFGEEISEALIQEYISGELFFINTVSCDGRHTVTDVWKTNRTKKFEGAFIFQDMELVALPNADLINYSLSCLDALHVRTGASHIEVIVDELGPVLVEVNCRLMGASISDSAFIKAGLHLQHRLSYHAYSNKEKYEEITQDIEYKIDGYLAEISLYLDKTGKLKDKPFEESVSCLKSFHSFNGVPNVGDTVKDDYSTLGTGGFIYLYSDDELEIKKDLEFVRRIKNDYFKIG